MRAVWYERFGPAADVLETGEADTPSAGPGEVLVRVAFSGVNPSDAKARAGSRPGVTKPPFPRIIPHSDGSGVIEAVGEGVDAARVGQRVWLWNGQWQRPFGTAAEYIALPEAQAVPLPEGVSLEAGATLGIPGLTAAQTVFGGGDVAGQTLLVSGGAGAVGHNAVQLAKSGGATVIATCSSSGTQGWLATFSQSNNCRQGLWQWFTERYYGGAVHTCGRLRPCCDGRNGKHVPFPTLITTHKIRLPYG